MALVDYSDSESEAEAPLSTPKPALTTKATFPKLATGPGKIKVDLPTIKPEPGQKDEAGPDAPPAKRARTNGGFSGINSFLPAPKRTAQHAPKKGISLKTSSEAAFSRERPSMPSYEDTVTEIISDNVEEPVQEKTEIAVSEPKMVGKATRFLPLSVSSKKKKKPIPKATPKMEDRPGKEASNTVASEETPKEVKTEPPPPKPRRSLFSMQQGHEDSVPATTSTPATYEPLIIQKEQTDPADHTEQFKNSDAQPPAPTNSLETVAADLNLTAAQRRQLFGRGGKDVNITHFNMDSEYASNEQMRQAGEVVEHRAIKAIAPGKHSLQQLVNNARTQKDAMEDKWAEGKKNRGEGASKYGWG